jgi:hypothetical protein
MIARTTISLEQDLLAEAKIEAARTGRTFSELVADALRERLARRAGSVDRRQVRLPVDTTGGGVRPGVDLDNSAALYDLLDEDEFER